MFMLPLMIQILHQQHQQQIQASSVTETMIRKKEEKLESEYNRIDKRKKIKTYINIREVVKVEATFYLFVEVTKKTPTILSP